jgi:hypothetical protein
MSCGGGYLEFSIGIKKQKLCRGPSNDHSWAAMVKCSNAFFSETTNMIKAKLYMNVHWMVLYKL